MKRNKVQFMTQAAMIAAVYVALCVIFEPISYRAIQTRIAEALTILPFFTPAAIPGLFIGCLLSNFICGAMLPDMIFGSLATLIGAVGTYFIGKRVKWLSALSPIAANTVIVPLVLKYAYHLDGTVPFFALTVFIGEFVCCGILGTVLLYAMPKSLAAQMT